MSAKEPIFENIGPEVLPLLPLQDDRIQLM